MLVWEVKVSAALIFLELAMGEDRNIRGRGILIGNHLDIHILINSRAQDINPFRIGFDWA